MVVGPTGKIRSWRKSIRGRADDTRHRPGHQAGLGPVTEHVRTQASAADGLEGRDVARAKVIIACREFDVAVAVTDRKDIRYQMMVGMDILRGSGFLVDPSEGIEPEKGATNQPAGQ